MIKTSKNVVEQFYYHYFLMKWNIFDHTIHGVPLKLTVIDLLRHKTKITNPRIKFGNSNNDFLYCVCEKASKIHKIKRK